MAGTPPARHGEAADVGVGVAITSLVFQVWQSQNPGKPFPPAPAAGATQDPTVTAAQNAVLYLIGNFAQWEINEAGQLTPLAPATPAVPTAPATGAAGS